MTPKSMPYPLSAVPINSPDDHDAEYLHSVPRECIRGKPVFIQAFLNKLDQVGRLTGSQAFGLATPESDYDYVIDIDDFTEIEYPKLGEAYELPGEPKVRLIGFRYGSETATVTINLIVCLTSGAYYTWVRSTDAMIEMAKSEFGREYLSRKTNRVDMFENMKEFYYQSAPLCIRDAQFELPGEPFKSVTGIPYADDEPPF